MMSDEGLSKELAVSPPSATGPFLLILPESWQVSAMMLLC